MGFDMSWSPYGWLKVGLLMKPGTLTQQTFRLESIRQVDIWFLAPSKPRRAYKMPIMIIKVNSLWMWQGVIAESTGSLCWILALTAIPNGKYKYLSGNDKWRYLHSTVYIKLCLYSWEFHAETWVTVHLIQSSHRLTVSAVPLNLTKLIARFQRHKKQATNHTSIHETVSNRAILEQLIEQFLNN